MERVSTPRNASYTRTTIEPNRRNEFPIQFYYMNGVARWASAATKWRKKNQWTDIEATPAWTKSNQSFACISNSKFAFVFSRLGPPFDLCNYPRTRARRSLGNIPNTIDAIRLSIICHNTKIWGRKFGAYQCQCFHWAPPMLVFHLLWSKTTPSAKCAPQASAFCSFLNRIAAKPVRSLLTISPCLFPDWIIPIELALASITFSSMVQHALMNMHNHFRFHLLWPSEERACND